MNGEARKHFFFEKKKQKTFLLLEGTVFETPGSPGQKFFAELAPR